MKDYTDNVRNLYISVSIYDLYGVQILSLVFLSKFN